MFNRNVPASERPPEDLHLCLVFVFFCECICFVYGFSWTRLQTGGWETVANTDSHSLTHPVSSSSNTHLLFFIPMKQQNVQNPFFPSYCSSLCSAIADFFHCTTSMDLIVVKNRSSLFLFAHFSSSPLG